MTAVTREYLDAAEAEATTEHYVANPLTDTVFDLLAALRRVLDLHHEVDTGNPIDLYRYRCAGCGEFTRPQPCATVRALAGTQTDDGAGGSTPASPEAGETPLSGSGSLDPAPSSPDGIEAATRALQQSPPGAWLTLPGPVYLHRQAVEVVAAALDAYDREHRQGTVILPARSEADLRERIAADPESIEYVGASTLARRRRLRSARGGQS